MAHESTETPVQREEVYAVTRHRLFEEETSQRVPMREIVHRCFRRYLQHRDDLPPEARDAGCRDKMEMAYPVHPDVLDILYEKWSTFLTFQRTRSVLRLLANVVEDHYQGEASLDLILPGEINLGYVPIRQGPQGLSSCREPGLLASGMREPRLFGGGCPLHRTEHIGHHF